MLGTETTSGTSTMPSPGEKINLEISSYLCIPTLDSDPLAWSKFENSRLPNLALLTRKYLWISVPSERMFSLSGHICNNSRNCLLPENVSKLIFLG